MATAASAPPSYDATETTVGPAVPFQRPELPPTEAIVAYYAMAEEAGFYSNGGPCCTLLSRRLADHLEADVHCIPVGNCTLGLMAALRAECAGDRGVVLTPSYTFTATACAIAWAGFEPVFVDIEPHSWHMDPAALDGALREHAGEVAGVLACSTFGSPPPDAIRRAWREACAGHGVPLLVDSAPGFGARDEHGRFLGTQGETEIFSFHATKPFAVGEGGVVVTADPAVADRVSRIVNFGLRPGTRTSDVAGLNAKMSELHAAAGLAMLDRIEDVLARRRASAARLRSALHGLGLGYQDGTDRSTWQIFHVLTPTPEMRRRVVELAPAHRVHVRTMHDPPLHRHPAFEAHRRGDLRVTDAAAAVALALPMANDLGDAEVGAIAALVRAAR